jgi:hypothetical protein
MTRRTTILVVALATALPALAQSQADPTIPRELTLQQAVDLAWQYNPTFRQIANDLGPATRLAELCGRRLAALPDRGIPAGLADGQLELRPHHVGPAGRPHDHGP